MDVPVEKIREFETEFLSFMRAKHKNILDDLAEGKLTEKITSTIENVAADLSKKYTS